MMKWQHHMATSPWRLRFLYSVALTGVTVKKEGLQRLFLILWTGPEGKISNNHHQPDYGQTRAVLCSRCYISLSCKGEHRYENISKFLLKNGINLTKS